MWAWPQLCILLQRLYSKTYGTRRAAAVQLLSLVGGQGILNDQQVEGAPACLVSSAPQLHASAQFAQGLHLPSCGEPDIKECNEHIVCLQCCAYVSTR